MHYSRWPKDEIERARKLWNNGLSVNAVAERMRCTRDQISGLATRWGFRKRESPIKRSPKPRAGFGEGQYTERWPQERVERALKLWIEGLTNREIGESLGTSRNAIIGVSWRFGFPAREKEQDTQRTRNDERKRRSYASGRGLLINMSDPLFVFDKLSPRFETIQERIDQRIEDNL